MATFTDLQTPATEPIPMLLDRPRLRDTFASLAIRNYRLYVISQVISNTSVWMQRIAVDWLVLELTCSVTMVGITVMLQFGPILLFGAYGGVIADRLNRRAVLMTTQAIVGVLCATLAAVTLAGVVEVWHVLLAAFLLGTTAAIDGPARAAFVSEMVGNSRLRNAISVNASIFHLGGLIGPAISGYLIVIVGSGWSIGVNSVAALLVVGALALMRTSELRPAPRRGRSGGQIREALGYVASKPAIFWSMVTLAFVSTFGMSLPVLLTAMADDTYASGATGYGLYSSAAAVGAFLGALASTRRTTLRLRSIVGAAIVFGVVTILAALAPSSGAFLVLLVGLGLSRLLFATAAESMTQLSSNIGIRGRVMSLYIMVLLGGQAIGGPLMGWIAEEYGARTAMVVAGLVPAIAGVTIAAILARTGQLTLRVNLRAPRAPVTIVRRTRRAS
ncbi:MFS transporter [Marisediminicola senii]|uniref:MFS transporter n=1 Tax=Marisediminicola senii TaxID=2711233 RepID=UPI001F3145E1|nr:MFS transporter [Marisediminicola senii]